ncbi:MAG: thioredoxin family protein [Saprospiraceae bacterium]
MIQLENILQQHPLVLVNFHADWCRPCRAMQPILAEVKTQVTDKIELVEINVDGYGSIARQYAIKQVPTLVLFKDGEIVWQNRGMIAGYYIEEKINEQLKTTYL